jgi:hypothetical protein
VTTDKHTTDTVEDFVYLSSKIHKEVAKLHQIKRKINLVNTTHFSILPIFKFTDVHQATETKLYKTLIRIQSY